MKFFNDIYHYVSRRSFEDNHVHVGITDLGSVWITIDDSSYKCDIRYYVADTSINGVIVFSVNSNIDVNADHRIKVNVSDLELYKPKFKLAYKSKKQENGSYDYIVMFTNI